MRAFTIAFALLQGANAFNAAKSRDFNLLADMGLNADGSAMDEASADSIINSLRVGTLKNSATDLAARQTAPETISAEYVSLKLDQFGKSKDTFNNRFWVAESGYKAGGPVFIYDVGEADASGSWQFRLQNETSFFKQIVDQFGGIGIVWEHRFCKTSESIFGRYVMANSEQMATQRLRQSTLIHGLRPLSTSRLSNRLLMWSSLPISSRGRTSTLH